MRRRISYANVAATLALVFSMSGGALAANHYLVNSTKQINPKVLKKLKGKSGPKGLQGAAGTAGTAGAAGKEGAGGKEGAAGKQGPSGVLVAENFSPNGGINESNTPEFLGETLTETFTAKTKAIVTGSVDYASSDGNGITSELEVCYEKVGGVEPTTVSSVTPEFEAEANSYFAQTVTGVIGKLAPGEYEIGLCTEDESGNVEHGNAAGSAIVAET